jgi:hypothetical protein
MSMVKVTFTVDEETVKTLRHTSERLRKPQSLVVREAIRDYADRADRLSEGERRHLLRALDRMVARPATRSPALVDAEIAEIRSARKTGGRASRAE